MFSLDGGMFGIKDAMFGANIARLVPKITSLWENIDQERPNGAPDMVIFLCYDHLLLDVYPKHRDLQPISMKHYKLSFTNKSIPDTLAICRRVADGVQRLPAEKRPAAAEFPVAERVAEAVAAAARVENLRAELRAAMAERALKVRAAREEATRAAERIFWNDPLEPALHLSAGLELQADKRPVGAPAAPGNFRARATAYEGQVELRWERLLRRCLFVIELTTDPAAASGWTYAGTTVRQKFTATKLAGGVKCWFRVRAQNGHGNGPWSQPLAARPL